MARFDRGAKFDVKRGDIVMLLYPKDTTKIYIKRVVGLPNGTVEGRAGKVFIDQRELKESYADAERNEVRKSLPPIKIGEHQYFVLGDNRDNSADSRISGLVAEKNILAKAIDR